MLRRWISATEAAPMPTFTTRPRIAPRSSSRWRRVSTFESFTLRMSRVSGVTRHAAATTGPASAAMPTSSTPTTRRSPCAHRRFSLFREGIDELGSGTGYAPVKSSALFAERGCLAYSFAEEVERGPACVAVPNELDLLDAGRMHHKGALDADPARDPADGDLLVDAAVTHAEHGALEVLKALAVPFDDPHADAHGVSGPDLGQIGPQLLSGKRVQEGVHRNG